MDDIGRYIWGSVVIILLILIAMFFAAVGTAVASLSGSQLKRLSEEEGDEKAGALFRIKQNQFGFSLFTGAATLLSIGTRAGYLFICGAGSAFILRIKPEGCGIDRAHYPVVPAYHYMLSSS